MEEVINRGEISKLKRDVLSKAELEREKILEEAKNQMKEKRKKEISDLEEKLSQQLETFKKSEKERARANIYGQEQQLKLQYREKIKKKIDELIDKALNELSNLDDKTKRSLYRMMLEYASKELEKFEKIEVPPKDKKLVESLMKGAKVEENDKINFGLIVYGRGGETSINLTISSLKEDLKERVLQRVVDEL